MPGDPFKPVRRGDPLAVPAEAYNAFLEAAAAHRRQGLGFAGEGRPAGWMQTGIVPVLNNSFAARDRFNVLGIDAPLITPTENSDEFQNRVALDAGVPETDSHLGRFAVLLEPVADGAVGMACVAGATICKVNVGNTGHRYAEIGDGVTASLVSAAAGSADIIWAQSGTGLKWAIVRLGGGAGSQGEVLWGKAAADWEPGDGNAVTLDPCDAAGVDNGQANVTGYIISPTGGDPEKGVVPVIAENDVLAYLPFGSDLGVVINVAWTTAGGSGGPGFSVSGWIDVDGEGTKTVTLDSNDWRSRVITHDIGWDSEPMLGDAFGNTESGVQVPLTATANEVNVFSKVVGNDSVRVYVDGANGGILKLEIGKGDPQAFMHLFYWVACSSYHPDPTT